MPPITDARAPALTIGELSRQTGVNVETIRYYERVQMLPAPPRTAGGRRAYDTPHRRALRIYPAGAGFGLQPQRSPRVARPRRGRARLLRGGAGNRERAPCQRPRKAGRPRSARIHFVQGGRAMRGQREPDMSRARYPRRRAGEWPDRRDPQRLGRNFDFRRRKLAAKYSYLSDYSTCSAHKIVSAALVTIR